MGLFNKKELLRIQELENELFELKDYQNKLRITEVIESIKKIEDLQQSITVKNLESINLNKSISDLNNLIESKTLEIGFLDDTLNNMDFGIYTPKYSCYNSDKYKELIVKIRTNQKSMISDKTALNYYDGWTLDGSIQKGKALNNDNMKMVLRAFNNECDVLINKVKFNNFDKIKSRIRKAAEAIDKLNDRNIISITEKFISLKIDELHAVYEYEKKKQEEKELLREERELEREDKKLQEEIATARKKLTKEIEHYRIAKHDFQVKFEIASDIEKEALLKKIKELTLKLEELNSELEAVDYRESNHRAGYVYVISNIGSFGEGVYKIGMTRRLEPYDRVDELSNASVPFRFDTHAMIFSDDAPKLEASLHKRFEKNRINLINGRKEFFKVALSDIKEAIQNEHEKLVEFKDEADAEQFRETLVLTKQNTN